MEKKKKNASYQRRSSRDNVLFEYYSPHDAQSAMIII